MLGNKVDATLHITPTEESYWSIKWHNPQCTLSLKI